MQILLTKKAEKQLDRIKDITIRSRLENGINGLLELRGDIKKLKGVINKYRLRVGYYRIIFMIENNQIIIIEAILPRGEVYNNI